MHEKHKFCFHNFTVIANVNVDGIILLRACQKYYLRNQHKTSYVGILDAWETGSFNFTANLFDKMAARQAYR